MLTTLSKITWSTSYANTLNISYLLDNFVTYPEPREGSAFAQAASGVEDAWIVGTDYILEFDVRWIPAASDALGTGWYAGGAGFSDFLTWARYKNSFRFYPDKNAGTYYDCYLVEPLNGAPTLEPDGTRRVHMKIRTQTALTI